MIKKILISFAFGAILASCESPQTELREHSHEKDKSCLERLRGYGEERGLSVRKIKKGSGEVKLMALRRGMDYRRSLFEIKGFDSLTHRDLLQYKVSLTKDAYVYVLLLDSSGVLSVLHPSPETGYANPVSAGAHLIPEAKRMWYLDSVTGRESFFFISAPRPIPEVEKMIKRIQGQQVAFAERGVGGVVKISREAEECAAIIDRLMKNTALKKHIRTFEHR